MVIPNWQIRGENYNLLSQIKQLIPIIIAVVSFSLRQHGGTAVSTVTSQQEGSQFKLFLDPPSKNRQIGDTAFLIVFIIENADSQLYVVADLFVDFILA